jgi:hypothetical protein
MMRRAPICAALGAALALGGCSTTFTGADGSHGYGATATLEAHPDAQKSFVAVFAIESRDSLSRFQLRSLSATDSAHPKAATALPPIPQDLVFVVDRTSREVTIWSPQAKHYFRSSIDRLQKGASGASPAADPTPVVSEPDPAPLQVPDAAATGQNAGAPATGANGGAVIGIPTAAPPVPLATANPAARKPGSLPWLTLLKTMPPLEFTMAGAGSERVDGHATTALDITLTAASPNAAPQKATAQKATATQKPATRDAASPRESTARKAHAPTKILIHINLADDYEGFPLSIRVRVPDARPGKAPMEMRLHMTNVLASSPPLADFTPPEGYEAVDNPAALMAPGIAPS